MGKMTTANKAFLLFFLLLAVLAFLVIQPFIGVILTGFVVAYLFAPLFKQVDKRLKNRTASALIVSICVVLVFSLPFVLTVNAIYKDFNRIYTFTQDTFQGNVFDADCDQGQETVACQLDGYMDNLMDNPFIRERVMGSLLKASDTIFDSLASVLFSLPSFLLNAVLLVFVVFFLLKDGREFVDYTKELLPFKKKFKEDLVHKTQDMLYATIYGTVIVAIVQGILAMMGFIIFDSVSSPFFWGLLTVFAAFLPYVGSALIWTPIGLIQVIEGIVMDSGLIFWKGIGLLLFGALLISTIDNLLKPKIIGDKSATHPLLIFFGVLGGLTLMGFIGIIVGPLIIALFMSFLEVYREDKDALIG